jgi:hypothetical protein
MLSAGSSRERDTGGHAPDGHLDLPLTRHDAAFWERHPADVPITVNMYLILPVSKLYHFSMSSGIRAAEGVDRVHGW